MYILGITAYYHDSSVCLFKNDVLIFACEEEKFSGIKHDKSFPELTLKYVLNKYQINEHNLECVCYYENPLLRFKRRKSFLKSLINNIKVWYNLRNISKKIHYTPHHLSHMAYSFFSSNFKQATVISVDGVGETSTISIGYGVDNEITQIRTVEYPHSLGLFYSTMTAFLGFKPNEGEYKVMGLSSYGNPDKFSKEMDELIRFENGTIVCNMNYFKYDKSDLFMYDINLEELLQLESRDSNEKLTSDYIDLSSSVQRKYEELLFKILSDVKKEIKYENLCLGGGCAYNGRANGKIIENKLYKHVWIPPAPSDAGSSIGSCLYYISKVKKRPFTISPNPFLGPSYDEKEILDVLIKYKLLIVYKKYEWSSLIKIISLALKHGNVVGWFQDKIEFGSRALGNRSILANPTLDYMKDRINSLIKKRENFRPFAPMVTYDEQHKYFDSREFIPYMNQIVNVNYQYRDVLKAVTHVDGTARVQSVLPNNKIYGLLKEFQNITSYPILLNTSFNIKDKTMVLTPEDAIRTFLDTDLDYLVINNYIISKTN